MPVRAGVSGYTHPMRQEYSIRFEPASGSKLVQAEAYVQTLQAMLEGLASLRGAWAPELAAEHGWPLPQVRDALTFSIGPAVKGSLIVPLIAGGGTKGAQLASDQIERLFWKQAGAELGYVAKGKATHLSATGAEAFARASAAAKTSGAKLSIASKTGRGAWRAVALITPIEQALRKHAASRRTGHRATTEISGQIVSLTFDPPGFILATSSARRTVRMPSALRESARKLWGQEVVVLSDAVLSAEGSVADIQALEIRPAATAQAAHDDFDKTFGIMRGAWDSEAVASQLGPSRH